MAAWKIHASWDVAAVLVTGVWGRWCGRSGGDAPGVAEGRAEPPGAGGVLRPWPPGPPRPGFRPAKRTRPARRRRLPPLYTDEVLTVDRNRALIRSDRRDEGWKAALAVQDLADLALKKELLLPLIGCTDERIRLNHLSVLRLTAGKECAPVLQNAVRSDRAGGSGSPARKCSEDSEGTGRSRPFCRRSATRTSGCACPPRGP